MKLRQIIAHMDAAHVYAGLSYCNRRKVGSVIVKDNRIISIGYNGTPPGACNCCEGEDGKTLPNVIHAEDNAIRKLKNSPETGVGATMFITTAPCEPCAQMIIDAGIVHVVYDQSYTNDHGIVFLRERGVTVDNITQLVDSALIDNKEQQ